MASVLFQRLLDLIKLDSLAHSWHQPQRTCVYQEPWRLIMTGHVVNSDRYSRQIYWSEIPWCSLLLFWIKGTLVFYL